MLPWANVGNHKFDVTEEKCKRHAKVLLRFSPITNHKGGDTIEYSTSLKRIASAIGTCNCLLLLLAMKGSLVKHLQVFDVIESAIEPLSSISSLVVKVCGAHAMAPEKRQAWSILCFLSAAILRLKCKGCHESKGGHAGSPARGVGGPFLVAEA